MMGHEITAKSGANKRNRRVGRGTGSGRGKTAGRGHKGQGSRPGTQQHPLNEGGGLPLFRRLPIRGFSNARFATPVQVVNVSELDRVFDDGADVNAESLAAAGLIRSAKGKVKVLGNGELSKKLTVTADRFSKSAAEKISQAGGSVNAVETGK